MTHLPLLHHLGVDIPGLLPAVADELLALGLEDAQVQQVVAACHAEAGARQEPQPLQPLLGPLPVLRHTTARACQARVRTGWCHGPHKTCRGEPYILHHEGEEGVDLGLLLLGDTHQGEQQGEQTRGR